MAFAPAITYYPVSFLSHRPQAKPPHQTATHMLALRNAASSPAQGNPCSHLEPRPVAPAYRRKEPSRLAPDAPQTRRTHTRIPQAVPASASVPVCAVGCVDPSRHIERPFRYGQSHRKSPQSAQRITRFIPERAEQNQDEVDHPAHAAEANCYQPDDAGSALAYIKAMRSKHAEE